MGYSELEHPFGPVEPPPVRPAGARASRDERLNQILEAATRVIARVGYQEASMREVARAAKVSLAGIYHYFDNKEKMLFLIQLRAFNSLNASLREKLHGVADPVQQLAIMVRNHLEYFAANIAALKVCSHELDSLSGEAYEETRMIRRQYYEETRRIIDRLLNETQGGEAVDRHVATMFLFGALNWLYRWYDPVRGRPASSIARQITAQFLHGIHGLSAGEESTVGSRRQRAPRSRATRSRRTLAHRRP